MLNTSNILFEQKIIIKGICCGSSQNFLDFINESKLKISSNIIGEVEKYDFSKDTENSKPKTIWPYQFLWDPEEKLWNPSLKQEEKKKFGKLNSGNLKSNNISFAWNQVYKERLFENKVIDLFFIFSDNSFGDMTINEITFRNIKCQVPLFVPKLLGNKLSWKPTKNVVKNELFDEITFEFKPKQKNKFSLLEKDDLPATKRGEKFVIRNLPLSLIKLNPWSETYNEINRRTTIDISKESEVNFSIEKVQDIPQERIISDNLGNQYIDNLWGVEWLENNSPFDEGYFENKPPRNKRDFLNKNTDILPWLLAIGGLLFFTIIVYIFLKAKKTNNRKKLL